MILGVFSFFFSQNDCGYCSKKYKFGGNQGLFLWLKFFLHFFLFQGWKVGDVKLHMDRYACKALRRKVGQC